MSRYLMEWTKLPHHLPFIICQIILADIDNPWSIINYLDRKSHTTYWTNISTSNNKFLIETNTENPWKCLV